MLDRSVAFALLRDAMVEGSSGVLRTVLMGVYGKPCTIGLYRSPDPLVVRLQWRIDNWHFDLDLPMEEGTANAVAHRLIALRDVLGRGFGQPWTRYLSLGDGCWEGAISFCSNQADVLLIPDPQFLESAGYADVRALYADAKPWEARKPQALWRGSTTGIRLSADDVFSLPRLDLCRIARNNPRFDCAIAGERYVFQMDEDEKQRVLDSGLVREEIPLIGQTDYRVNIDIDGNTNSWPGLFCKLLAGSPVVKVISDYRQWYYDKMIPYYNYVPAASDLSDLQEVVDWCMDRPAESAEIGLRGRELALTLTIEAEVERARNLLFRQ